MDNAQYAQYLQGRTWKATLYRNFYLYPRLARRLPGRILDVGCGIGDFLRFSRRAEGVDVNPILVEGCRSRGLRAGLIENGRYPHGDSCFDSAIADNVIEHLSDPAPLLAEVRRVLKPGGRFLLGVPGRAGYDADPDHKRFYDEAGLKAELERAGFLFKGSFETPLGIRDLKDRLRQGCLYALFESRG